MATGLGRIAAMLQTVRAERSPLQQRLDQVGQQLALVGVAVAVPVVVLGALAGESPGDLALTAISVAVTVIPEGLPAVETLGSVTTIASLQLFQALGTRSRTKSLLAIGLGSNRLLLGIAGLVAALQLVALYTPLRTFLGLGRLGAIDVAISIAIGASLLVVLEASKAIARRRLARG